MLASGHFLKKESCQRTFWRLLKMDLAIRTAMHACTSTFSEGSVFDCCCKFISCLSKRWNTSVSHNFAHTHTHTHTWKCAAHICFIHTYIAPPPPQTHTQTPCLQGKLTESIKLIIKNILKHNNKNHHHHHHPKHTHKPHVFKANSLSQSNSSLKTFSNETQEQKPPPPPPPQTHTQTPCLQGKLTESIKLIIKNILKHNNKNHHHHHHPKHTHKPHVFKANSLSQSNSSLKTFSNETQEQKPPPPPPPQTHTQTPCLQGKLTESIKLIIKNILKWDTTTKTTTTTITTTTIAQTTPSLSSNSSSSWTSSSCPTTTWTSCRPSSPTCGGFEPCTCSTTCWARCPPRWSTADTCRNWTWPKTSSPPSPKGWGRWRTWGCLRSARTSWSR